MSSEPTTGGSNTLYIVSTSHMDWDWNATFEQYYNIGIPDSSNPDTPVRWILDQAITLMQNQDGSTPGYQYNLAEIAWLQRYMQDNPITLAALAALQNQLFFLGGGITSPDNLVCNGEAFIRNYLMGQNWINSVGLGNLLTNVCWIPDDFGHDPQLPVVLNAMGMTGVTFARLPGEQPNTPAGTPYTIIPAQTPSSLSNQLQTDGLTFFWTAMDGTSILSQFMYDPHQNPGYGVIWNQGIGDSSDTLTNFVTGTAGMQPNNLLMAPCGGDFSLPSYDLVNSMNGYNASPVNSINAQMGTFQNFIDAMNAYADSNPGALKAYSCFDPSQSPGVYNMFDPSNYWTGHFASRVQLKINQQRAVNRLMAAETLSTLLRAQANIFPSTLNALNASIDTAWGNLLPSTHHDYITGTAPDQVYKLEQLPLLQLALQQSEHALCEGITLLGTAVNPNPQTGEIPYVVFNPSGFSRNINNNTLGSVVEIAPNSALNNMTSYRYMIPTTYGSPAQSSAQMPIQRLSDGTILIICPNMESTGYTTVYFSTAPPNAMMPVVPAQSVDANGNTTFSNGVVTVTASYQNTTTQQNNGWALSSIVDVLNNNTELLTGNNLGNSIQLYYEGPAGNKTSTTSGNLYQFGNELYPTKTDGSGFYTDQTSAFTANNDGVMIENGPYRWCFSGTITNQANSVTLTVEYILEYNEPLVRMRITGQAPAVASSVVSCWQLTDASDNLPAGMYYGTPNHWSGTQFNTSFDGSNNFSVYWNGPTFRSTHDYLTLVPSSNMGGDPVAAMYHEGMRAWTFNGEQLMGVLFRNAPGTNRGAAGTDLGQHTQNFAFRIPGVGTPDTCQPLQESIAFQQRQVAAPVVVSSYVPNVYQMNQTATVNNMSETGMLASMQQSNAIIRVARTQQGSGGTAPIQGPTTGPLPFSFVLRMYQPTNLTSPNSWEVNVPFMAANSNPNPPAGTDNNPPYAVVYPTDLLSSPTSVSLVTALEANPGNTITTVSNSNGVITITNMPTLATIQIQTVGTNIVSVNGKE